MNSQKVVTPVDPGSSPGGVQMVWNYLKRLDSGFRRNDIKRYFETFRETINLEQRIKLRSEATSLFDVQRWTFDVRCSMFSLFDIGCSSFNICKIT
jgi:hypothetical protein